MPSSLSHKNITFSLLPLKKIIIKEKPLALNSNEIKEYINLMKIYPYMKLFTIVQRNFNPCFIEGKNKLKLIGKIYNFSYDYDLNIENITSGWRAEFKKSFGGVLIDMGYHVLDIILSFFNEIISVCAINSFCYEEMKNENLEDSINVIMQFKNNISGVVNLNRHSHIKKEIFIIRGEKGIIEILPSQISIYDRKGIVIFCKKCSINQDEIKISMFDHYIKHKNDKKFLAGHFRHHINIVFIIDKIYQHMRNRRLFKNDFLHYQPLIMKENEKNQDEFNINLEKIL